MRPYAGGSGRNRPTMTDSKRERTPKGCEILRGSVPAATAQWFRDQAAKEGIPIQAVLAPVLNAYARGEIRQDFTQGPGADVRGKV